MLNIIKENKEIKIKKKYQENISLISSIMVRKLRLRQKNAFLIKKCVNKENLLDYQNLTAYLKERFMLGRCFVFVFFAKVHHRCLMGSKKNVCFKSYAANIKNLTHICQLKRSWSVVQLVDELVASGFSMLPWHLSSTEKFFDKYKLFQVKKSAHQPTSPVKQMLSRVHYIRSF